MEKSVRKILAMCLSFIMIASMASSLVFAKAPESTEANSDLLYSVDFSGKDGKYKPEIMQCNNADASLIKVSPDGKSLTVAGDSYVGGEVKGLPLDDSSVYTIKYTSIRPAGAAQAIYFDTTGGQGHNGFYGYEDCIGYFVRGGNESGYYDFGTIGIYPKNKSDSNGNVIQQYKMIVDCKNRTLTASVLLDTHVGNILPEEKRTEKWGVVASASLDQYGQNFQSPNLHLIFRTWLGSGAEPKLVTFSNVEVYKGIPGTITVNKPGEVLLDLGDMSLDQSGNYGVKYVHDADEHHVSTKANITYKYDKENDLSIPVHPEKDSGDANNTIAYGGSTNLLLGHGQKYTITYDVTYSAANGGLGVRHSFNDYRSSHGIYMSIPNNDPYTCIARGTATGGSGLHPYKEYGPEVMVNGNVFGAPDGYAKVAIEIDDYKVTIYLNGALYMSYSNLDNDKSVYCQGFSTDTLSLVIQGWYYGATLGEPLTKYRDIKVYSGLVVSEKYVDVINGSSVSKAPISGDTFTLPMLYEADRLFRGWKINGEGEAVKGGTKVPTKGLVKIEAVWEEIMGKSWVQFKDNGNGTQDMRIVSTLDSLKYKEIGYKIVIKYTEGGSEKVSTIDKKPLGYVYKSLSAKYGTEKITAEKLGYSPDFYLTSIVITDIPKNLEKVTVELTPYQVRPDATEPVFGSSAQVIVLNNGVLA